MKKKGFTLIELIVVIAIIGVLAAILVPAMLGYVKKSKVTTANTTAKSIYNALNSSLTDMDSEDKKIKDLGASGGSDYTSQTGSVWAQQSNYTGSDLMSILQKKVYGYFSDVAKVSEFAFTIDAGGACVAASAMNGAYPGSYPKAMTVDDYNTGSYTNAAQALAYAKS